MNRFEDYYRYGEKMLVHKGEHIYDSMSIMHIFYIPASVH